MEDEAVFRALADPSRRLLLDLLFERDGRTLTTSEFTSRYYYGCTLQTDLTVGSPFTYHMPNGSPIVEGEVVASEPPNRLVHTYHSRWSPMNEDAPTRVTWELEAMPDGVTKVTVVHEDFQGHTATYQGLQGGGWTWILSNMKTFLETGEPMPQGYSI